MAQHYADTSVYADASDDRNIKEEIIVAYIEQRYYGEGYEPRSEKQIMVQDPIAQAATSIFLGVVTAEALGAGGVASTAYFSYANIQEKKALGMEVTESDYQWGFADIVASAIGGTVAKSGFKLFSITFTEQVTTDLAAETTAEVAYQTGKAVVINNEDGDGNG